MKSKCSSVAESAVSAVSGAAGQAPAARSWTLLFFADPGGPARWPRDPLTRSSVLIEWRPAHAGAARVWGRVEQASASRWTLTLRLAERGTIDGIQVMDGIAGPVWSTRSAGGYHPLFVCHGGRRLNPVVDQSLGSFGPGLFTFELHVGGVALVAAARKAFRAVVAALCLTFLLQGSPAPLYAQAGVPPLGPGLVLPDQGFPPFLGVREVKNPPGVIGDYQIPFLSALSEEVVHPTQWDPLIGKARAMSPKQQLDFMQLRFSPERCRVRADSSEDWKSPRRFLIEGGDCEDFAIVKYAALRWLGWPAESLRIVIGRYPGKRGTRGLHALLAVHYLGRVYILNNYEGCWESGKVQFVPESGLNESWSWNFIREVR